MTPLPPPVWDRVGEVADAVLRTAEELTPPEWHLIFTAYLDGKTDVGTVTRLERAATTRGSYFVPVRLLCDPTEISRRITSPERRRLMKSIDPAEPLRLSAAGEPYDPGHVNGMDLDITERSPAVAAQLILEHASALPSQNP